MQRIRIARRLVAAAAVAALATTGTAHALETTGDPLADFTNYRETERALTAEQAAELEGQKRVVAEGFAKDADVSLDEARKRIGWQMRMPALVDGAKRELGAAYGGAWIDVDDGNRLKVGVVGIDGSKRAAVQEVAAEADLADATDVVGVTHSWAELDQVSQWLMERLEKVNQGQPTPVVFGTPTDRNVVEIQGPEKGALSPDQRQVVDEAVKRFGDAVALGTYKKAPALHQCMESPGPGFGEGKHPYCNPPLRGGITMDDSNEPQWAYPGCTSAFVVRGRGANQSTFLMTAGHCLIGYGPYAVPCAYCHWTRFQYPGAIHVIGDMQNAYNGIWGDAGIIKINNVASWGPAPMIFVPRGVDVAQNIPDFKITAASTTHSVGQRICKSGAATGYTSCGNVKQENVYDGQTGGLTRGNWCGINGDSGSPVWFWIVAYGVYRGGFDTCDGLYVRQEVAETLTNADIIFWPNYNT